MNVRACWKVKIGVCAMHVVSLLVSMECVFPWHVSEITGRVPRSGARSARAKVAGIPVCEVTRHHRIHPQDRMIRRSKNHWFCRTLLSSFLATRTVCYVGLRNSTPKRVSHFRKTHFMGTMKDIEGMAQAAISFFSNSADSDLFFCLYSPGPSYTYHCSATYTLFLLFCQTFL